MDAPSPEPVPGTSAANRAGEGAAVWNGSGPDRPAVLSSATAAEDGPATRQLHSDPGTARQPAPRISAPKENSSREVGGDAKNDAALGGRWTSKHKEKSSHVNLPQQQEDYQKDPAMEIEPAAIAAKATTGKQNGGAEAVAAAESPGLASGLAIPEAPKAGQKRRGLALYDSEPEISAASEGAVAGTEDVDDEIVPRIKPSDRAARKKPARRKRARLVAPHSRSSRYRGVYWEPKGSKWYSSISSNHKQIHLGSFNTEEEAAHAFDQEALRLRGPATFTNFPVETYLEGGPGQSDAPLNPLPPKRAAPFARRQPVKRIAEQREAGNASDVPEKDDQAATALLSLGSDPLRQPEARPQSITLQKRPSPPRSIEPPVTHRGQKRKRGGSAAGLRVENPGRARSKYTGVYQQSRGNGWFASICVDKSMKYLGTFASEEEAARAFDQEALRLRGRGVELNLPNEPAVPKLEAAPSRNHGSLRTSRTSTSSPSTAELESEGLPQLRVPRKSSGEAEEEEPGTVREGLARPARGAASRSRSLMGRLARSLSKSPGSEEEQDEGSEQEAAAVGTACPPPDLPVWRGRRARSATRKGQSRQQALQAAATVFQPAAQLPVLHPAALHGLSTLAPFASASVPLVPGVFSGVLPSMMPQGPARPASSLPTAPALLSVAAPFGMAASWAQLPPAQPSVLSKPIPALPSVGFQIPGSSGTLGSAAVASQPRIGGISSLPGLFQPGVSGLGFRPISGLPAERPPESVFPHRARPQGQYGHTADAKATVGVK